MEFLEMKNVEDLANYLGEDIKTIKYLVHISRDRFSTFFIEKSDGNYREINAPNSLNLRILKRIKEDLDKLYKKNEYVKGFCSGESILSNAKPHVNRNLVLNVDIKDFFPSIHFGRIYGLFRSKPFGFNKEVSFYMSKLCTWNDVLPQGSPASPIISNFVCGNLDIDIGNYCKKYKIKYTRYADDLTFSTNRNAFPNGLIKYQDGNIHIGKILSKILEKNSFKLNDSKTRIYHRSVRQDVTNLTVNKKVNINKHYIRRIRSLLHTAKSKSILVSMKKYYKSELSQDLSSVRQEDLEKLIPYFLTIVKGRLHFIKSILGYDNLTFLKYANQYNEIVGEETFDISPLDFVDFTSKRVLLIQNKFETVQGSGFMTNDSYLITSTHVLLDKDNFYSIEDFSRIKSTLPQSFDGQSDFIYVSQNKENKKLFSKITIYPWQEKLDIYFEKRRYMFYKVELAEDFDYQVNTQVFAVGYGEYIKGEKPKFIKTRIIGDSVYLNRFYYQTKDNMFHGMSGGPVFNQNGKVIGVIYCGMGDSINGSIVNGFIPINKKIILDLVEKYKTN